MKNNILFLIALTVAAILGVVFLEPGGTGSSSSESHALLLPDIGEAINTASRVEIITADNNVVATLVKTGDEWRVEQMGAYRADWTRLQALLAGLAQARIVEVKTSNPEYYSRLAVEDIANEDAGGVLVRFTLEDLTSGVLVGNRAQGREGQYVRLEDTAVSALVDRQLDVPTELKDWADTNIVDISASEVAEVEIIHPHGGRVLVTKISADQTDFELVGMPPERETQSSWSVNSLGSVFSLLKLESVRPVDQVDWSAAVRMRLMMFSGVEIITDLVVVDETFLLRLEASHPAGAVTAIENEEAVLPDEENSEKAAIEKQAVAEITRLVDDINQRVNGWAYGISENKYEAMVKEMEDLLKPVETL